MLGVNTDDYYIYMYVVFTVDGNWAGWTSWSGCSVSCGGGKKSRTKPCTNPAPAYGGKTCGGSGREEQTCSTNNCPSTIYICVNSVKNKSVPFGIQK